jgi:hypothetical protein
MQRPPLVVGLHLCEDVVADTATRNVSLIRVFTGLGVDAFPCVSRPICAFTTLTAGLGEAPFRLEVSRPQGPLDDIVVHAVEGTLHFESPVQTVHLVVRLTNCPLPAAGDYLFTLWVDGVLIAQRSLRVYLREEQP